MNTALNVYCVEEPGQVTAMRNSNLISTTPTLNDKAFFFIEPVAVRINGSQRGGFVGAELLSLSSEEDYSIAIIRNLVRD
jgi:hypothetical protein